MSVYITRINGLSFEERTQYMQCRVAEIAQRLGVKEMGIYRYNADTESAESLNARMDGIIAGINRGDLIICQFPTGNGLRFEWSLINHLKAYGARIAIFLHDFVPLLYENMRSALQEFVNLYNQAEVMIVPSLAMRQFLLENRLRRDMKFIIQEMWDYPVDLFASSIPAFKKEIALMENEGFEGIGEWQHEALLKLYSFDMNSYENKKIQSIGAMNPNEIFLDLSKGGFGLVWYKDENEHKYMEHSISFSLSQFIAAGIPIIAPTGISNQRLLEENHLGLIANSLNEAIDQIETMSETEYQEYVQAIGQFAPALRKGYYTEKCLIETMQAFYRKDVGRLSVPAKAYKLEGGVFSLVTLRESYGGNLALSWVFQGKTDGFLVYDDTGKLVYDTRNKHQHYYLIKGYGANSGFIVKAYVETMKGKMLIAESELSYQAIKVYENPKVSLIIPAYNAEEYITRCIDTALAQSFVDLEVIIVDDGSTDKTPDIINWYAEKYLNVKAFYQRNSGVASARNTGIKEANGDYIGFMDNDDMLHPDMITRLYCSAKKNDCDIAITSVYQIKNYGYEAFVQYPMEEDTAITVEKFFEMHFQKGCMFAVVIWNKLYRASLVKKHLLPVMIADDNAWTPYILSYAEKVCYLDDRSYEWDRKIRTSTQVDQWQKRSKEELFHTHRDTTLFYLKNGNPKRLKLLKQLAERQLSELRNAYAYEEYEKLWNQINEMF